MMAMCRLWVWLQMRRQSSIEFATWDLARALNISKGAIQHCLDWEVDLENISHPKQFDYRFAWRTAYSDEKIVTLMISIHSEL